MATAVPQTWLNISLFLLLHERQAAWYVKGGFYGVSRLFCKMLFVLCNVKLGKYRYYGINRGTTWAPFSGAAAPWEPAWIQSMTAGTAASRAVVGQPLLGVSRAWRIRARPVLPSSLLRARPAAGSAQLLQLRSRGWANGLRRTYAGSVCVLRTLRPWVAADRLQLGGELLLKYSDVAEQPQAWNWAGVLLVCALQERVRRAESKEREGCILCFGWILGERCSRVYFFPCCAPLCVLECSRQQRLSSLSKRCFA